jgi:archaellum component FlaG (FlaF/FlaG flagellin family)
VITLITPVPVPVPVPDDGPSWADITEAISTALGAVFTAATLVFTVLLLAREIRYRQRDEEDRAAEHAKLVFVRLEDQMGQVGTVGDRTFNSVSWKVANTGSKPLLWAAAHITSTVDGLGEHTTPLRDRVVHLPGDSVGDGRWVFDRSVRIPPSSPGLFAAGQSSDGRFTIELEYCDSDSRVWLRTDAGEPPRLKNGPMYPRKWWHRFTG